MEVIRLEDRRPWLRRAGAVLLLCVLAGAAAAAFLAQARQRREVTRRAQENLASITHLTATRLNGWLYSKAMISREILEDGARAGSLRLALARGEGDARQRELLGAFARGAGFAAAGVADRTGRWLPQSGVGDPTLLCPAPCLDTRFTPACSPHRGMDGRSRMEFPVPLADGKGHTDGYIVFVEVLPKPLLYTLGAYRSYSSGFHLEIVERENGDVRVVWASDPLLRPGTGSVYLLSSFLPAQEALDGAAGPGEGPHVDSLPYLYATSYVPRTRWGVVATVPREEVLAPVRTTGYLAWGFTLLLIAAGGGLLARLWSRGYRETLARSHSLLAALVKRLLRAQEEERTHLSHELHDGLAQYLAAAQFHLAAAHESLGPAAPAIHQELGRVSSLLSEGAQECRRVIADLRPPELEELDLVGALGRLAPVPGPQFRLEAVGAAALAEVSPEVKCVLYRIAQEAVANAVRHAAAGHVVVTVAAEGGGAVLEVRDDGRGITPRAATERGHYGLAVMRERAGLVGGALEVESEPGRGTTVRVRGAEARRAAAPARPTTVESA